MRTDFDTELEERLLRYTAIDTQSDEASDSQPSTAIQLNLSRLLEQELIAIGAQDVRLTDYGVVLATIPATVQDAPTIGFLAHVDTAPQFNATGVKPRVHRAWDGSAITYPDAPDLVLSPETSAYLGTKTGDDIVTASGTTLLGADDKAGVAIMLASMKALLATDTVPPVDLFWLFTIAEEVGHGAAAVLVPDIASLVAIDNGTSAPGQNSAEYGVTIAMADQTGPFDYHLTRKLVELCQENDIRYQKDVFRFYRSDSASAIEAGEDVRTALITFGVSASHGYERIHMHALRSLAELVTAYGLSGVEIPRDEHALAGLSGFTRQPSEHDAAALYPAVELPPGFDDLERDEDDEEE